MKPVILILLGLVGACMLPGRIARADDAALPGAGFSPSRYQDLWTKSPFSVATPEAIEESPDYLLVGIAEFGGVSYASVVDRKTQGHFLVSTDKPTNGLTLTSVTRGHDGSDTFVVVQRDGQPMTLRMEQMPTTPAPSPGPPPYSAITTMPGSLTPQIQIPMPGAFNGMRSRPLIRFHRSLIHLPPPPVAQPPPPPGLPSAAGK